MRTYYPCAGLPGRPLVRVATQAHFAEIVPNGTETWHFPGTAAPWGDMVSTKVYINLFKITFLTFF